MFTAQGNYVWQSHADGTSSVVAVTMGNISAESIAEGLNLLREKEHRERIDGPRQAMRDDVALLHRILGHYKVQVSVST